MDYMIYNGIDSRDFGLYVVNDGMQESGLLPSKQSYTIDTNNIQGRLFSEQNYTPRKKSIKFQLKDNSISNKNLIVAWLGQLGEGELILSYERYKLYTGVFEQQVEVDNYLNAGIFTIDFILYSPLAKSRFNTQNIIDDDISYDSDLLYDSGLTYDSNFSYEFTNIIADTDIEIYNGSSVDGSEPKIIINGSADEIIINKYTDSTRTNIDKYISHGAFNGELIFDCENRVTTVDGVITPTPIDGNYIELDADYPVRIISGQSISNTIDSVSINGVASEVDDFYNGYYISVFVNDERKWYEIIDYDGLTKTVYVDGVIDGDVEESYGIYDIKGSINYFTIAGTNLNITNIKFIFNFMYL